MSQLLRLTGLLVVGLLLLTGCGGSKVLKAPKALVLTEALAVASDERAEVMLDWVIIRDGPGTWAKNAKWDEYLLRVRNVADTPLEISDATVEDSLGTPVGSSVNRRNLVKGSKAAARRYRKQGLKVRAGVGGVGLMAAGAGAAVAGYGVGMATLYGAGSTAAGAAVGALLLAPALVVGGVVRSVNESRVSREIELRSTDRPLVLRPGEQAPLVFFVPITPSPQKIKLSYTAAGQQYTLALDARAALEGLHLKSLP